MKKITKREKLIYTTLISVVLAILLLSIVSDVYAKYSSTLYGKGDIELARWEFKANGKNEGEDFLLNINTTDSSEGKISPNSTGSFQIILENKSNVAAEYTIALSEKFLNTNTSTNALKIYSDSSFSEDSLIDINSKNVVGKLENQSSETLTFYWKWVEDPSVDQVIAENYSGFSIFANVVGEQTQIISGESLNFSLKNK